MTKRNWIFTGFILCVVLAGLGCSSLWSQKGGEGNDGKNEKNGTLFKSKGGSWPERMRGMAKNLEALIPYAFSRQEFTATENKPVIRELIVKFEKSVDAVPQHTGEVLLGKDPLVRFAIGRLQTNTRQALQAFEEGNMDFSRNVLRENLGLCFNCHTTMQFGPENTFSAKSLPAKFRIQPTERAEYYVATRQFDRAVDLLESFLKSPVNAADDPREQMLALKKYLSLQVRVKKDPASAVSLLQEFLSHRHLPYFLATDVESWVTSLRDWQKENGKTKKKFERAQALLMKAKFKQSNESFQSGYVENLRASSLLHESLRDAHDPVTQAKIYQLLGQSYETLSETGTWDLPEAYYEACVRMAPQTPVAQSCYKDFERSIILGFSGSAGVFIPKEETDRLNDLKRIAGLSQ